MTGANEEYEKLMSWGAAVRIGINGTTSILQTLMLKKILTKEEALAILADLALSARRQTSTNDAEKQVIAASYDQARQLLNRTWTA